MTLGLLFSATARADDDIRAELDALKKRVAELENKQNASDDAALRKAVERLSGPTGPTDFRVFWDDGLRFETADKAFSLHIGGRLQYDAEWFHTGANVQKYPSPPVPKTVTGATARLGNQADGDELRRLPPIRWHDL